MWQTMFATEQHMTMTQDSSWRGIARCLRRWAATNVSKGYFNMAAQLMQQSRCKMEFLKLWCAQAPLLVPITSTNTKAACWLKLMRLSAWAVMAVHSLRHLRQLQKMRLCQPVQQAMCRLHEAPAETASCLFCMQAPKDAFIFQIPSLQNATEDGGERR